MTVMYTPMFKVTMKVWSECMFDRVKRKINKYKNR